MLHTPVRDTYLKVGGKGGVTNVPTHGFSLNFTHK